ncbi:MAG: sugar phosphate isomerase/epimerase [Saprospiraceae bacterium]|nr:sugar phosphate isomerase/epimerase [Saprospiraceae bacterium]
MHRRQILAQIPWIISATKQMLKGRALKKRLKSFGLQLSTITPILMKDFEGTLRTVAAIGYNSVEFSALGYINQEPTKVKDLLAELNLKAPIGRVSFKVPSDFMSMPREQQMKVFGRQGTMDSIVERIDQAIGEAKIMGQKYLIIPAIMPHTFSDMTQIKSMISALKSAAQKCQDEGIQLGYHNHNWEFNEVDGNIPYEIMLKELPPAMFTFQLDTYWIKKAGLDPTDMLEQYPNQFSSCHFKDIDADGQFEDVGYGNIDFPRFTKKAVKLGIQHFFVERDGPEKPMHAIRRSYEYLQQMKY